MDVPDQDVHNFTPQSTHRLPPISGIEALRNAQENARPISTGLPHLDEILRTASPLKNSGAGGIQRGVVTEVFGPPGIGKTTFVIQLTANVIASHDNSTVLWIDTSSQVIQSRIRQIVAARIGCKEVDTDASPSVEDDATVPVRHVLENKFRYMQISTLTRLLTLFMHPMGDFPPKDTSLVVLDDLSNLIQTSLPHSARHRVGAKSSLRQTQTAQDATIARNILSRRFQVLANFASSLQKFAVKYNTAVVVTSKATVNLKAGQRAMLRPALTSQQWDKSLSTRISIYRKFWPRSAMLNHVTPTEEEGGAAEVPTEFERRSLRITKVTKLDSKLVSCPEVAFVIEEGGLRELQLGGKHDSLMVVPLASQPLQHFEDELDSAVEEDAITTDPINESEEPIDNVIMPLPQFEAAGTTKRKAIEIADSEDETDDNSEAGDGRPHFHGGRDGRSLRNTSPRSQTNGDTGSEMSYVTAEKFRAYDEVSRTENVGVSGRPPNLDTISRAGVDENEEMLLETYERIVPLLSQAAAEMSDPLTPSDDDRDI